VKRALGWLAVIVLLGAVGAGGFYGINRLVEQQEEEEPIEKPELVTRTLTRGDLIESETLEGRLRYQDGDVVYSSAGGVVTWLPEEGVTVERGGSLLELNGAPVVLLYGERPSWRPLADGIDDGSDVEQLEENLVALGYDPDDELTVDQEFTEVTAGAVEDWQADLGLEETGIVDLGRVIFEEGAVRISRVLTEVGATVAPGAPIIETSGADREIVVMLAIDQRDLVAEDDSVVIVLPDDAETPGTITSISNIATVDPASGDQVVEMTVAFDRPADAAEFEQAVVDVEVVSEQVLDALLAPVEAVLALAEGGYAVEVVDGGTTRLVGVELGKFADGLVEIVGNLQEGDLVAVPR
jgi:peptidoglycan hydrolase-like protein with peptidoglycan-binding domain